MVPLIDVGSVEGAFTDTTFVSDAEKAEQTPVPETVIVRVTELPITDRSGV